MIDYFKAYTERLQRNDDALKSLASEVLKKDPEIEAYFHENNNRYKNSVIFFKGELINSIQFHEVPYHWSGCGIKDHSGGENVSMPFDVDDVITTFHPVREILRMQPNDFFKSKEQYLKWHSWLKRWEKEI